MNAFIGITDYDWFKLLSSQEKVDEINFWQPGGNRLFSSLEQNELFLFKLHSPRDYIVGGGIFTYSTILPVSLAWDTFGIANGALSLQQMRDMIGKFRREKGDSNIDYKIGCILLTQPFFFSERDWVLVPNDWKSNIVQGKRYDLTKEPGSSLYNTILQRLSIESIRKNDMLSNSESIQKYGNPIEVFPRLHQGSFRIIVTDAYGRKCAISNEKVLPVLIASHIRPYSQGGNHRPNNGILLRSDIHTLFDRFYLTITPKFKIEVSKRIREDYENGHEYYAFHGKSINIPRDETQKPSLENLAWHNERYLD